MAYSSDSRSRDRGDRGRSGSRGGFGRSGGRDRFGGGRSSGRSSGGFGERRQFEMHDVTCDKCGKACQVPFKPTGDKPVLCSDCFRAKEGGRDSFSSRNERPSFSSSNSSGSNSADIAQINAKLDKIIAVLKQLEIIADENPEAEEEVEEDEDEEDDDEDEEESDDEEEEEEVEKASKNH